MHPLHTFYAPITTPPFPLVAKNSKLGEQSEVSLATLSQLPMILLDLHLTKGHYVQLIGGCRYNAQISQRKEFAGMVRSSLSNGFGFPFLDSTRSKHIEGHSRYCPKLIRDPLPACKFGILIQNGIKQDSIMRSRTQLCKDLQATGTFEQRIVRKLCVT